MAYLRLYPVDACLAILRDHLLKECVPGLQAQSAFHICLPWHYPARDTSADTRNPACLARNLTLATHYRGFLCF